MTKNKPKYMNFKKLNSNKKKELIKSLKTDYDYETEFLNKYIFYITSKNKIMISKVDIENLNLEKINSLGIYFGVYHNENRFRLSLEGSKFIKPKKNYIKINAEILKSYLSAENLFTNEVKMIECDTKSPFKIVQYENENLGCVSHRDKELLTYLPKSRKLDYNKVF